MKESKSWCPSCSEGGCIWRDYVTQHPPNSLSFGNLVWLSRKWITTKLTRCNLKPRWNCGDLGPVWQVYMSQYPSRNLTQDPISRIGPRLNLRKTRVECTQAGGFRPFATQSNSPNGKPLSMQQETRPYVNGFPLGCSITMHTVCSCDVSSLVDRDPSPVSPSFH